MALLDTTLHTQLREQLTLADYHNFSANLEQFSAPYPLKTGAMFYEARRDALNTASAIVVGPDGLFYLAYTVPNSDVVTYVTNDSNCHNEVHDAIKVVMNLWRDEPQIKFSDPIQKRPKQPDTNCQGIYSHPLLKHPRFQRS